MSVDRVSCIINVCSTWLRKRFTRVFLNASIREDFHFFDLKKKNYETLGIKIDLFICILLARDLFHRTRCGRKFACSRHVHQQFGQPIFQLDASISRN